MKCVKCGGRKGKRACPALKALICPQCCGEERVLEIDCPEECGYLAAGRALESAQERKRQFGDSDPVVAQSAQRIVSQHQYFLSAVEYALADERRASADVTDRDAADALDLILKTLRTEDKGILYEQTSSDLRVEGLRRRLLGTVEDARHPQKPQAARFSIESPPEPLRLGEAIECLEFIREIVARHLEDGGRDRSYVDFLARLLPREGARQSAPSIIIPGR